MAFTTNEPAVMKPEFNVSATVTVSERSTASDLPPSEMSINLEDLALDRFGYKAELERRFGFWSMVGLSCTIMVTWEGWFVTAGVGLTNGGFAGCIWGFLFCWIGYTAVIASLAELISMIPTAGGQYHWTWELAPTKYKKFVSWITGWQIVCAWQADLAAVFYLLGTMIQSLVILNKPDYVPERWHGTLIIWGLIVIAVLFNTFLAKMLPMVEGSVLVLHCTSFLVVLVPLVYFAPHASVKDVFTQFSALGGYSPGLTFFVGLITTVFAFIGADGAIHMCEEVKQARTVVPNALMASAGINGALGFGMVIAVMFTIGNISEAIQTKTGYLFIDYFARALESTGFATGLCVILLALFMSAIIAILASASRVTWAFARDNGLPGSSWIKKVSSSSRLPVLSILLSAVISLLLSLINIGSSVAFNAMVSLVVSAFFGSYAVPIGLITWKRVTKQDLDFGPWKLGRFGLFTNVVALLFLSIAWLFSFFPVSIPIVPETMNWSCVLWGGIMLFGTAWYFVQQRKVFIGPTIKMGHMDLQ